MILDEVGILHVVENVPDEFGDDVAGQVLNLLIEDFDNRLAQVIDQIVERLQAVNVDDDVLQLLDLKLEQFGLAAGQGDSDVDEEVADADVERQVVLEDQEEEMAVVLGVEFVERDRNARDHLVVLVVDDGVT